MTFNHFNFNVLDLEKSLKFYQEALNLVPNGEVINAWSLPGCAIAKNLTI